MVLIYFLFFKLSNSKYKLHNLLSIFFTDQSISPYKTSSIIYSLPSSFPLSITISKQVSSLILFPLNYNTQCYMFLLELKGST